MERVYGLDGFCTLSWISLYQSASIAMIRKEQKYKDVAEIKDAIDKNGWDGGWYRRAYFDDGTPLVLN